MARSHDRDTNFFDIAAGVSSRDTLSPYLFKICLDYVPRKSIDLIKENGITLQKARIRRYPAKTMQDTDYADELTLLANTQAQAESQLRCLKQAAGGFDLRVNDNKRVNGLHLYFKWQT